VVSTTLRPLYPGCVSGPVWTDTENVALAGNRSASDYIRMMKIIRSVSQTSENSYESTRCHTSEKITLFSTATGASDFLFLCRSAFLSSLTTHELSRLIPSSEKQLIQEEGRLATVKCYWKTVATETFCKVSVYNVLPER
jgi:hypothetical protein